MVSAITKTLRTNNKTVYVSLLSILTFFLMLDYIPGFRFGSLCKSQRK
jgi:hypothetical protein